MLLDPGVNAAKEQTNPKRCNCSCIAPNRNVKVKNMDYCENSNEKLMFFEIVYSRPKIRCTIFLKKSIKPKNIT